MQPLDQRIISLSIEIDGQVNTYGGLNSPLYIEAKGRNMANPSMGDCQIVVLGLKRDVRNYILQNTLPLQPNNKIINVQLDVGRQSYGTHTRFIGQVFRSASTEKPDIGLTLECRIGFSNKTKLVNRSGNGISKLSSIAQWIADDNGYKLSFEVTDKNISSYTFAGSAQRQLDELEDIANSEVYVENNTLYVKDVGKPATGVPGRKADVNNGLLSASSTESGVSLQLLYDPVTTIGTQIAVTSEVNPSINGSYIVYKSDYHVANRADPFYLTVEASPAR